MFSKVLNQKINTAFNIQMMTKLRNIDYLDIDNKKNVT